MHSIHMKPPWALFGVVVIVLGACSALRTEFYRKETFHLYTQACKLYQQGAYTSAQAQYLKVIDLDPDYGPALAALGHLALIDEDYPQALNHYQTALAADPELEAGLRPFIITAEAHRRRDPLRSAGVGLCKIYSLLMKDRLAELEALLAGRISLRLIADDTICLTPGMLSELQRKAAEFLAMDQGGSRLRLFLAYLIFNGRIDDALAAAAIEKAIIQTAGADRVEALLVLGQLCERLEQPNRAVDAYLAAVSAGQPLTEVAHHLARLYRTDIAAILAASAAPPEAAAQADSMQVEFRTVLWPTLQPDWGASGDVTPMNAAKTQGAKSAF